VWIDGPIGRETRAIEARSINVGERDDEEARLASRYLALQLHAAGEAEHPHVLGQRRIGVVLAWIAIDDLGLVDIVANIDIGDGTVLIEVQRVTDASHDKVVDQAVGCGYRRGSSSRRHDAMAMADNTHDLDHYDVELVGLVD